MRRLELELIGREGQFILGSSWTRDQTCVPCIGRWILYHWATSVVPPSVILMKAFSVKCSGRNPMGGEGFRTVGRGFKFKRRKYILLCYQGNERNRIVTDRDATSR